MARFRLRAPLRVPTIAGSLSAAGDVFASRASARLVIAGDSMRALNYQSDPGRPGFPLTRRPPMVVANLAHANDTTADWLALLPSVIDAAVDLNAEFIWSQIGTNQAGAPGSGAGGVGSGDEATDIATGLDMIDAAGKKGIISQVTPLLTDGTSLITMNNAIAAVCAARSDFAYFFWDARDTAEGSYVAKAGMLSDDRHLSYLGAYTDGLTMATDVENEVPPQWVLDLFAVDPLITDATDTYALNPSSSQWASNPNCSGTGGLVENGTGVCPDEWILNSDGAVTLVGSITADGAWPWTRLTMVNGVAGKYFRINIPLEHPAILASYDDLLIADALLEFRCSMDTTNLEIMAFRVHSADVDIAPMPWFGLGGLGPSFEAHGVLRNSYVRNAATAHAANSLGLVLGIRCANDFTGGTGWIEVRKPSVRGLTE